MAARSADYVRRFWDSLHVQDSIIPEFLTLHLEHIRELIYVARRHHYYVEIFVKGRRSNILYGCP